MTSRPAVYASTQGRTRGGVSGPAAELSGAGSFSAMTAFPFRREHHGGPGAGHTPDPVQRADGGLECRDVGHADLENVALAPGDPPAVLYLGQGAQPLLDPGVVDRVALDHTHEGGDVETERGRVDDGPVAGDDPGGLQFAHPLVDRRRRQPDLARELGVTGPAVGEQ